MLLSESTALAQQPSATEDPARVEEARGQYRAGVQAFQRQRFTDAVIAFERSFRARPHPATLYNAAEARMRAGDNAGALAQLRELMGMTSPAPEAELQGRARALAQQMGEASLQASRVDSPTCPTCPRCAPQRECPPPPPPEQVETHPGPLAWGLAGGALFLTSLGAAFVAVASDNASTFENDGATRELQLALRDQGQTYRILGVAGLVLGVGAAVGATWFFLHPPTRRPPRVTRFDVGLGPGGVALQGSF